MKIPVFVILLLMLLSCNNNQTPSNVVSRLEDSIPGGTNAGQNRSKTISSAESNKLKVTKSLINVNIGVKGVYAGTIDDKDFKLYIDKVYGDNAEGRIVMGTEKKPFKGKATTLGKEPAPTGDVTLYRLVLSELNKKDLNGQYIITLTLSAKITTGEGIWMSNNKKVSKTVKITGRAI
ncbi:MAG: hypothetical protein Q8908_02695 [Bacteroidota bacterium]|nr:hypothetical protein [Bacteroidota bacterium]